MHHSYRVGFLGNWVSGASIVMLVKGVVPIVVSSLAIVTHTLVITISGYLVQL